MPGCRRRAASRCLGRPSGRNVTPSCGAALRMWCGRASGRRARNAEFRWRAREASKEACAARARRLSAQDPTGSKRLPRCGVGYWRLTRWQVSKGRRLRPAVTPAGCAKTTMKLCNLSGERAPVFVPRLQSALIYSPDDGGHVPLYGLTVGCSLGTKSAAYVSFWRAQPQARDSCGRNAGRHIAEGTQQPQAACVNPRQDVCLLCAVAYPRHDARHSPLRPGWDARRAAPARQWRAAGRPPRSRHSERQPYSYTSLAARAHACTSARRCPSLPAPSDRGTAAVGPRLIISADAGSSRRGVGIPAEAIMAIQHWVSRSGTSWRRPPGVPVP